MQVCFFRLEYGKSNGYKSKYTTRRELIADKYAHVYHYEGGVFSIVVCLVVYDGKRGMINAEQVVINDPEFYNSPLTSLVCVENTNKGGGACYEIEDLQKKFASLIT
jgi:threonine aldolase